jgi:predicted HicB family RNase H-like nuclease
VFVLLNKHWRKKMNIETKTFSIRIGIDLLEKIARQAIKEKRSVNYIIIHKLEKSFEKKKQSTN